MNARRSEGASAATVPSIFNVGSRSTAPSKANFAGAPLSRIFNPALSPRSAAAKSPSVTLASSGSPRQVSRPVAAKLAEIDGQASDISTSLSSSCNLRASSRMTTVPPSTRISENDIAPSPRLASGLSARVSEAISGAQFERRFSSIVTAMRGWVSTMSAISMRPVSSGKKRSRAVSRSAVSGGSRSSPSTTSEKLTLPVGKSETETAPRIIGSSPVTARICAFTASRTLSAGIRKETTASAPNTKMTSAATANPRRLKPVTAVNGNFPVFC